MSVAILLRQRRSRSSSHWSSRATTKVCPELTFQIPPVDLLSSRQPVLRVHRRLRAAGIGTEVCPELPSLVRELESGAGLAVVTEDALRNANLKDLSRWLSSQPSWSDLAFVLLALRGGGIERNPALARLTEVLGNYLSDAARAQIGYSRSGGGVSQPPSLPPPSGCYSYLQADSPRLEVLCEAQQ